MVGPTNREILYPPVSFVETFHDILIRQSGESGYLRREMVVGCIDWANTEIYDYVPFPGLLKRGAAILYAYITFHPFVDGNKRTALMTASFFFFINGYSLAIPDDSPDFTKDIAEKSADESRLPSSEIERIATWFRPNVSTPILTGLMYRAIRKQIPAHSSAEALFRHPAWERYYQVWRVQTTERFRKLLGRWPGHFPRQT